MPRQFITALLAAWLAGPPVHGAGQDAGALAIQVTDPRPLAAALDKVEARYGWLVNYEDPLVVPRGGEFSFTAPAAAGPPDEAAFLEALLSAYRGAYPDAIFRVVRRGDSFDVAPAAPVRSLLDAAVSLQPAYRNAAEFLADVLEDASAVGGVKIAIGTVPSELLRQSRAPSGVQAMSAREALGRMLALLPRERLSWRLFCGSAESGCALHLHRVGAPG